MLPVRRAMLRLREISPADSAAEGLLSLLFQAFILTKSKKKGKIDFQR